MNLEKFLPSPSVFGKGGCGCEGRGPCAPPFEEWPAGEGSCHGGVTAAEKHDGGNEKSGPRGCVDALIFVGRDDCARHLVCRNL
jgi:hypothetical protein